MNLEEQQLMLKKFNRIRREINKEKKEITKLLKEVHVLEQNRPILRRENNT